MESFRTLISYQEVVEKSVTRFDADNIQSKLNKSMW